MPQRFFLPERAYAPIEPIKDRSMFRVRGSAIVMAIGHPLYFWIWSSLYPQPYESPTMRLIAMLCGVILFIQSFKWSINSPRLEQLYLFASFFSTIMVGTWFFVGNNGNVVWLSSYCVLLTLYFNLTDWRIAVVGVLVAILITLAFFPLVHGDVWIGIQAEHFYGETLFVTAFAIASAFIAHFMDKNVRVVQMANQRRALGIAAHEVRTPLASINLLNGALICRLEEMRPGTKLSDSDLRGLLDLARDAEKSVAVTLNVINTHLANANTKTPFSVRLPVGMRDAIESAIAAFAFDDIDKRNVVSVRIESDFSIAGDPVIVQQVLRNLLDNAYTAVMKRNKVATPGSVRVVLERHGMTGILTVVDDGIGIDSRDLKRVFDPFHTTSEGGGHGLGLTFVKSAIRAYGGTIKAHSEINAGARFSISLPIVYA